jgi:ADP-heptose:LPS heptosyltransferase
MFKIEIRNKDYLYGNKLTRTKYEIDKRLLQAKNITLIKTDMLGDLICLFELIDNIKYYFKNCSLSLLTKRYFNNSINEIFKEKVDNIIFINLDESCEDIKKKLGKTELIIDANYPNDSYNSIYEAIKSKNINSIGFNNPLIRYSVNVPIEYYSTKKEIYLNLLRFIGIKIKSFRSQIKLKNKDIKFAEFFTRNKKVISLCFEASSRFRTLPQEKVSRLLSELSEEYSGYLFIILGCNLNNHGYKIHPELNNVLNLTGRTTIGQACALIKNSKAMIAVDTALMHIASNLGTPVLVICGSADPGRTGPQHNSTKNVILNVKKLPFRCMYKGFGGEEHHCGACIDLIQPKHIKSAFKILVKSI